MLKDKIIERRALREKVLSTLYDSYFNNNGAPYRLSMDDLIDAPEEKLAYNYLVRKGLVERSVKGGQIHAYMITAHGIDVVENEFLNSIEK
ncbi:hypothetical protein [Mesobacillus zeae]|uniref:DNA-binding protein n=1 Tax=Mesobacillus zeae TaxID=1917180 RepID=A0A398B546_9BACI|nr:hypothetical protein [Mesobacillus zeae]RID85035.1 hypothetical protein D1970_10740 [Mesobacillus zeae]